jgi:hypothetical protein
VTVTGLYGVVPGDFVIHEYANLATSSLIDVMATAQASSGSTLTVGPISTTVYDLVFSVFANTNYLGSTPSGFTLRESVNSSGVSFQSADTQGISGSYSAVWDSSGVTSGTFYGAIIGFKATSGVSQIANLAQFLAPGGAVLSAVNGQGQFVLPATSGAPTNTPTACAICFDPATKKLWAYDGTAWVGTTLS